MKRAAVLFSLLALTACSRPAPDPEPVASSTVVAPLPVAPDPWVGKYEGSLMVRIGGMPKSHTISIVAATAEGCSGDIGLAGGEKTQDVSGQELTLSLHPDSATTCTIDVRKSGDSLQISESGVCTAYHGAKCSFNGQAQKLP